MKRHDHPHLLDYADEVDSDKPQHWLRKISPGKVSRVATRYPARPQRAVQMSVVGTASTAKNVHEIAKAGVQTGGGRLPHLDLIQRAFGLHDISQVQAHMGDSANEATRALGARAYATGENVVLGSGADLHTVAHEAAHVIQQRQGVQLSGGVGQAGDAYERHANQVADKVVRGHSATDLLQEYASGAASTTVRRTTVQRQEVQLEALVGTDNPSSVSIVQGVAATDNVHGMRAILRAMRQVARQRTESGGVDHVVCRGGGDSFDLMIASSDFGELQRLLERRIGQLRHRALSSAVARGNTATGDAAAPTTSGGRGAFARGFNREFASILPALRQADRTSSGGPEAVRSREFTSEELTMMFTARQRTQLMRYFAGHVIPDRLFDGDEVGGCNAQQRIVISGYILSHGTYQPGSFSQQLHARMCGHWAQLTHHYAGVSRSGGMGVAGQFNHGGQLVLGGGRASSAYSGTRRQLEGEERNGHRQFRRAGMPIEQFDSVEPGDWLYIHTGVNTAGGDHSVVFSHWLDTEIQTQDGIRYRRAITFDQGSPERGGQQNERYLGERGSAGGHRVYPITRASRFDRDALPPQTTDDLIAGELGVRDGRRRRDELMPELGNGAAAQRNFRYIMRMENRYHGRLDMAALKRVIRETNERLIAQLGSRTTDGQQLLFRDVNQRDDLETLVRLNERLAVYVHNSDALATAELDHANTVETHHDETAASIAAEREALNSEIEILTGELARASTVVDLDQRIRQLERERRRLRRRIREARPRTRRGRRQAVRDRAQRLIDRYQGRIRVIERKGLPEAQRQRDTSAAAEEHGRHTPRLGRRGMSLTRRRNRLRGRLERHQRELAGLEGDAGYYTAQPGSRNVFRGRQRRERGEGSRREARATGRLENLRPPPPWQQLVTEGQPGSAVEARQRRRQSSRDHNRRRRERNRRNRRNRRR